MPEIELPEDFYEYAKGKEPSLCRVLYCRARRGATHLLCEGHLKARWRAANPRRATFQTLRDCARRRRLSFTISFGWFCNFCNETGYLDRRGNGSDDMHLDRIDATLGYEPGNLQVLSCAENVAKGNRERMDEGYQAALATRGGEDDWYDPDAGDISRWVRGEGEPF